MTKINGRNIIETNSTMGNKTIIQIGAPIGNICAKKPLKSVIKEHIKIGNQNARLVNITLE